MSEPLVLIEPYAHRMGGHHQRTLIALARARPGSVVIAPNGIAADGETSLRETGARMLAGPHGATAGTLLALSRLATRVSAVGQWAFRPRRWPRRLRRLPHQITLLARCLAEASALRIARQQVPGVDAVVILTASEALHGLATLLGGQPHLRFVHEQVTTEDLPVRVLGRLARRGEQRTIAVCPTQAVGRQLSLSFPDLPAVISPFAVDDGQRLTDVERDGGRVAFGIPAAEAVVCLVGGWWPYKDIDTVDKALPQLKEPLHLVVVGTPLDEAVLGRWRSLPGLRVHTVPGPVSEVVLRLVYAAADVALATRIPGTGKESGLVMDAARLGVPLLISNHDPALTTRLDGLPWARTFPAGEPAALTDALHTIIRMPPVRPGPEAPEQVGMRSAAEQADFLTRTFASLENAEPRPRSAEC